MKNKWYFTGGNCVALLACLLLILLGSAVLAFSASASDVYPLSRRGGLPNNTWAAAGIPGGIPTVATVYTKLSPGITLAQLNATIAACPSNQVVFLNAGTYNLGGTINLTKDGVVLRGATDAAGLPTTFLNNVQIQTVTYWGPESGGGGFPAVSSVQVSSGYTEGSTSLTLASPPNSDFAVGAMFVIDQTDDNNLVISDNHSPALYTRSGRAYCMPLICTNISGNVISFTPPLLGTYWAAARSPQIYGWNSTYGATRHRVGIENVDVTQGTASGNYETLKWMATHECWIYNVRVRLEGYAATALMWSVNSEIRHCIVRDTVGTGSANYGTELSINSYCRVEDNIYTNLSLAITTSTIVGNSVSFNYVSGPYPYSSASWLAECIFPHGGHPHHSVFEGNWSAGPIYVDAIWGNNNSYLGIVRNRTLGYYPGKTGNTIPITLEAHTDNTTIIGNSLGAAGYHTSYSQMYSINSTCTGTIQNNNYNTVNNGVNPAEAIGANTMLDSYVYASKPAWFGNRNWPPFGPVGYGANGFTNIPAGYRSFYGTDVPGGSVVPPSGTPPSITSQPVGITNSTTAGFTLAVGATGSGSLTYQWRLGGANVAGATASSYSQVPATVAQSGNYSCVIANPYGSIASAVVSVIITQSTAAITRVSPSTLNFTVSLGGSSNQVVHLNNTGASTLTGYVSLSAAGPWSIVGGANYSLGPNASTTITVRYAPTSFGDNSATLSFVDNGGGASVALSGSQPKTYVWPVGDSITRGGSTIDTNFVPGGYRLPLYQLLTNAGVNCVFVGNTNDNSAPGLPYPNHDGYPGYKIENSAVGVPAWVGKIAAPDYVLLMTGFNDFSQNNYVQTATNRLENLIVEICTNVPNATVVVADLNPWVTYNPTNAVMEQCYNPFIPSIVARQAGLGRKVLLCDMRGTIPSNAICADKVHPNALGYNIIATNWFSVIRAKPTPPPAPQGLRVVSR